MKICICGGGHTGHVAAGFLASFPENEVYILTRKPSLWSGRITVTDIDGNVFNGKTAGVTDNPQTAVEQADIVLLCLPGFSIKETLERIRPFLCEKTAVGSVVSSTGFFFQAFSVLSRTQPLFGFQRVPFISRISEYGHSAQLLGYKPRLYAAVEQCGFKEQLRTRLERLFQRPVTLMENHYEVSLSNSNPLLHTSRLYSLWKDYKAGTVYNRNPYFYEDWTEEAAALYIAMDNEFQTLLKQLPVRKHAVPPVLEYYESRDAASLARKISGIAAFKGLLSPMKKTGGGWVPDFSSRYFTEDFPFGLKFIRDVAVEKNVPHPLIEKVLAWGCRVL